MPPSESLKVMSAVVPAKLIAPERSVIMLALRVNVPFEFSPALGMVSVPPGLKFISPPILVTELKIKLLLARVETNVKPSITFTSTSSRSLRVSITTSPLTELITVNLFALTSKEAVAPVVPKIPLVAVNTTPPDVASTSTPAWSLILVALLICTAVAELLVL